MHLILLSEWACTAYVRVGNESVECNSQQLLSLVLEGTHMTWDSLPTQVDASKHSFIILANIFREQTHQEWNDKYLESFGLVTSDGKLTNAGLLFVDNCAVFQSCIFCTSLDENKQTPQKPLFTLSNMRLTIICISLPSR